MKITNYLIQKVRSQKSCLWLILALFTLVQYGNSQCVISVTQMTHVSVDELGCEATITPDMVGASEGCGTLDVTLELPNGTVLPTPTIDSSHVGMTLTVKLTDPTSRNTSWGYIKIEDKTGPVLENCPDSPVVLECWEFDQLGTDPFSGYLPTFSDNCNEFEVLFYDEAETINNCDGSLGNNVLKLVSRTYYAVDKYGNRSEECRVTFRVRTIRDFQDRISAPANYMMIDTTALSCDGEGVGYHLDENGNPHPADVVDGDGNVLIPGTGFPLLNIQPEDDSDDEQVDRARIAPKGYLELTLDGYGACNLMLEYEDKVLPTDDCVKKIMRTWTVYEWSCRNNQRSEEFIQFIEIADTTAPVYECPSDVVASTNTHECLATVTLPSVDATDNCADELNYFISWDGGSIKTNGGTAEFPVGVTEVTYLVTDPCGNKSKECTINVTVSDKTPPVTICKQYITVSLTNEGLAKIKAEAFDNGSYDECEFSHVQVRRMNDACADYEEEDGDDADTDGFDNLWFDYIHFCCEDLGRNNIMVVMRAWDKAGNYNDCMVEVNVQDKIAPVISCPDDVTVDCDYVYDVDNLNDYFGAATVLTGCGGGNIVETVEEDLNQCRFGTITRRFSVTNAGGTDTCSQVITFGENEDYFDYDDIRWPEDTLFTGCSDPTSVDFLPENLGTPTYNDLPCDLVGATYHDEVYPFNNANGAACFKIIRRWTVIDWCQLKIRESEFDKVRHGGWHYEGGYYYPKWSREQVIKVVDKVAPTITSSCDEKTECTYDVDCSDGFIALSATATDNCTQALRWRYQLDAFNDGTYEDLGDDVVYEGIGGTATADGEYPVGTHRIVWTFSDRCGNETSCEQLFTIENCKTPTPYCLNGLAVDLMPIDDDGDGVVDRGMVELWASDFDRGSLHPCSDNVMLSFEPVTLDSITGEPIVVGNKTFDCSTRDRQDVNIYAAILTKEGKIVQDFCRTFVDVQDNTNACSNFTGGDTPKAIVRGTVKTATDKPLADVVIALDGADTSDALTSQDGSYAFDAMAKGGTYSVNPSKRDDYKNGVNTLDIVLIQRHILKLAPITDASKLIAADVNNDNKIKSNDLLSMRKVVLGLSEGFPNNDSWKFVDANFNVADLDNPLGAILPEVYDISALNSDMIVDFTAIKIGDVNDDVNVTGEEETQSRSARTFEVATAEQAFVAGSTISVPVTAATATEMFGTQFTLDLGKSLELAAVSSDLLSVGKDNFSVVDGQVVFSWSDAQATDVAAGDVLFTLELATLDNGVLSQSLDMTSTVASAELYDGNLEVLDMEMNFRDLEGKTFAVYQNTPNPFHTMTAITFDLPEASDVSMSIVDLTGKVVMTKTTAYEAGSHTINVDKNTLPSAGIYYYQIKAGQYTATKKMVVIE